MVVEQAARLSLRSRDPRVETWRDHIARSMPGYVRPTMTVMPAELLGLPHGRPLTADDLELVPDDGHRYELVDGVLVVSPSPRHLHQRVALQLSRTLYDACPPDLELLLAPFDVWLSDDTVMVPDLLVARATDITERNLPTAPVLAVEVLSPSTRSFDLHLKKDRYRQAGCAHYWTVDPGLSGRAPSITAWRLEGEQYVEAGTAVGEELLRLVQPFPVEVVPARLVQR
jgi:Uma2 family endonuclease